LSFEVFYMWARLHELLAAHRSAGTHVKDEHDFLLGREQNDQFRILKKCERKAGKAYTRESQTHDDDLTRVVTNVVKSAESAGPPGSDAENP